MKKEFGVELMTERKNKLGRKGILNYIDDLVYQDFDGEKIYVASESEHIFEPKEGDYGFHEIEGFYMFREDRYDWDMKIIMRNNKQFFMPELLKGE